MVKLNVAKDYETIGYIKLDERKTPIAFKAKVEELLEEGCAKTEEEARGMVMQMEIELEVYYEKGHGLFAVESEAVESTLDIYSPYTGKACERPDNDNEEEDK